MNAITAVQQLPDAAQVPISFVREVIEAVRRERAMRAADREDTIEMWCELATRNLCRDPASVRLLRPNIESI